MTRHVLAIRNLSYAYASLCIDRTSGMRAGVCGRLQWRLAGGAHDRTVLCGGRRRLCLWAPRGQAEAGRPTACEYVHAAARLCWCGAAHITKSPLPRRATLSAHTCCVAVPCSLSCRLSPRARALRQERASRAPVRLHARWLPRHGFAKCFSDLSSVL